MKSKQSCVGYRNNLILTLLSVIWFETRMHSSRMRTAQFPTILVLLASTRYQYQWGRGRYLDGVGKYTYPLFDTYLPRIPTPWSTYPSPGYLSPLDTYLPLGYLPRSPPPTPGRDLGTEIPTLPPTEWLTDAFENITFLQLLLQEVINTL